MVVDIVLEDKFCNPISPVSGYVYIEDIILGSLHAELAWSFHPGLSLLHECFFDHAWFRRKLQALKNIRSSVQPWRDPGNIIYEYFTWSPSAKLAVMCSHRFWAQNLPKHP